MLPEEPVLSEECDEEFFISKLIENAKKLKMDRKETVYLKNWFVDNENPSKSMVKGNVWEQCQYIQKEIESIEINEYTDEVIITTEDTRFFCPLNSLDFDEQDTYKDVFSDYELYKKKYIYNENPIEPGNVLIYLSSDEVYLFKKMYYCSEGKTEPIPYITHLRPGTISDCYYIQNEDMTIDLRYFLDYRPIEFYSESTDGRPWFVENEGTEKIEIKTSVGKFELEPGERKQII